MKSKTEIILSMFDIKKLNNKCNEPNCENKPKKEKLIYEQTVRRGKKSLVSLYLCNKHICKANKLVTKLKSIEPKVVIDMEVNDLR